METISVDNKKKVLSVTEAAGKWWKAKNVFYSTLMEEDVTNREVVLVQFIMMTILLTAIAVEVSFVIAFISLAFCGVLVACLNKTESNENINIKKNIL